jgi:hypothetical protein
MPNTSKIVVQDYGTNCRDCQRYKKLGDICMIEHGKKFQWEFCRDFEPVVVLPDYNELMKSVRADHALERKKEKEKKEKEKRRRQKEREEKKELRRKKRRAMLRKRRERLKKKALQEESKAARSKVKSHSELSEVKTHSSQKILKKRSPKLDLENSKNSIIREGDGVTGEGSNISDNERQS